MSHHFFDIHLLPDPELPPHVLLAALFTRLHKALTELETTAIGVCFPAYQEGPAQLGNQMRLFGTSVALARLQARPWLGAMRDHVSTSTVVPIPQNAEHRTLRRVQAKSSPARLRRRQMRRHGISEIEALNRVPDSAAEHLRLPFLQVRSASTDQTFCLFLKLGPPQAESNQGDFNAYGLSISRTIPWF